MTFTTEQQEQFVRLAMEQAEAAIASGGTPFGAVLVDSEGELVAAARSTVTLKTDILGHAELNLLRAAHEKTGQQKYPGYAIFINATSCSMCASAVIKADISDIYFGAPFEPHMNPALSYEQMAPFCNEPLNIHGGILELECVAQIARARSERSVNAS